jgi:hypothetical protein
MLKPILVAALSLLLLGWSKQAGSSLLWGWNYTGPAVLRLTTSRTLTASTISSVSQERQTEEELRGSKQPERLFLGIQGSRRQSRCPD